MVPAAASETEPMVGFGPEGWVEIGRVGRPHGVEGGLLVLLHSDDPANLLSASQIRLEGPSGAIAFKRIRAESVGHQRDGRAKAHVWVAGLRSRDRAEIWSGASVAILETELQPLPTGEFYWRDILGLEVRGPEGERLGRVEEIWPTGSNDILVVRGRGRQYLIPALRQVLARVDLEAGELWIQPFPGLLDDPEEEGR